MKKFLALILVILMFALAGCNNIVHIEEAQIELVVFAAASLTETMTEIAENYESDNPNVTITLNFDSSGTLKTQIEEGAVCDVFISASQTPMDELTCVSDETRVNLLENKVALVVSKGNPKDIDGFDDVADKLSNGEVFMAVGNADVPVGEYTLKIFDYYNLSVDELDNNGVLTYGSNVKEVTTQVSESMVDCGVVYQTDAYSASLQVVDTATEDMCGQVIFPAAVLSTSVHPKEAIDFLEYVKGDKACQIFESVGFTPIN